MCLSIYVQNWASFPTKEIRSYADQDFPGLELEDFIGHPEYTIENNRAFTIKKVPVDDSKAPYTSKMSHTTLAMILQNLGVTGKDIDSDHVTLNELPNFIEKLNNKLEEISPKEETPNTANTILPSTHNFVLEYNYRDILRVAELALENNRGIFWINN